MHVLADPRLELQPVVVRGIHPAAEQPEGRLGSPHRSMHGAGRGPPLGLCRRPALLPLEGIVRQRGLAAPAPGIEGPPIRREAPRAQLRQPALEGGAVGLSLLQAGQRHAGGAPSRVEHREQRTPRSQLQQQGAAAALQRFHGRLEQNALANLPHPVVRGRERRGFQLPGDGRDHGDAGFPKVDACGHFGEGGQNGIHAPGMECVADIEPLVGDAAAIQFLRERAERCKLPGHDNALRTIDTRQVERQRRDQVAQRCQRRAYHQHSAPGGCGLHQPAARCNQAKAVLQRKDPGLNSGRVFAHAVANQHLRLQAHL
jgi:hypothetical protein